ncbi:HIT family protein [bacterium]|nr:MAG: HIT family protein [bacterium]
MLHLKTCEICRRIASIKKRKNPYFVKELRTGYVVLGDHQFFKGYSLFLYKWHISQLHEMGAKDRKQFLEEMGLVGAAVFKAFKPKQLNYELLGNTDYHLHWHIFPRYKDDPRPKGTIWKINKNIRDAEKYRPTKDKLESYKKRLLIELK